MLYDLIAWLLALELFGALTFPFLAYCLPGLPDRGYAFSKVVGFCVFGYLAWALPWFFKLPFAPWLLWAIVALLLILSTLAALRLFGGWKKLFTQASDGVLKVEITFFIGFVLLLIIRAFQPEVFWGEKPMDFTFLNYLIRDESLPPMEPWASGFPLRYYYMGTYIFAAIHKLLNINPAVGFNLAIASIAGLFLSATYGAMLCLRRNTKWAMFGALGIGLLSNIEVLRLTVIALMRRQEVGFDLFWASSRIHTSPAFAEYPLWSFIFADLHAHLMALPLSVALIGLGVALLSSRDEHSVVGKSDGAQISFRMLYGFLAGSIFAINAWDFITQVALLLLFVLFQRIQAEGSILKRILTNVGLRIQDLIIFGCAIAFVVLPFRLSIGNGPEIGFGWVLGGFSTVGQIFRHLGHWLVPLLLCLFYSFGLRLLLVKKGTHFAFIAGMLVATVPFIMGYIVSYQNGLNDKIPWLVLIIPAVLLWLGMYGMLCGKTELIRAASTLSFAAASILCATELVFVMDRMNTIFKFYHPIWQLLGLATFALIPDLISALWKRKLTMPILIIPALFLLVTAVGGLIDIGAMIKFHRVAGPRPTLDGMAYLDIMNQDEADLFRWIQKNVRGSPVLLEAHGNSYAQYTRISMNTGLPTVLGWDYHVHQRGVPEEEIQRRKGDIQRFYSTQDARTAAEVVDRYGIELVAVGSVERENYQRGMYYQGGLKKFRELKSLFYPIYRSGVVTLYATPNSKLYRKQTNGFKTTVGGDL